ncbi:alpha/beta fold hydrolase [Aquincola sp. MAHUQ-54]|uniref:Alpha/beta fold hydrolase n=1 Tax=Aquincola agrisoli TaxID=3119538 RepID=A0AAW9Q764_9BURK
MTERGSDMKQDDGHGHEAAQVLRVETAGGQVAWRRFGRETARRPLLLLHGGHGSWRHWARNAQALAAGRVVWVADMPGYGDSDDPPQGSFTGLLDALAESVARLPGLHAGRFDLAGFSFGGLVAAKLAERLWASDGPRVAGLILLGAAGHGGARRPRGALQDWHDSAASGDRAALERVMRQNLLMHMLHAASSVDALAVAIHTEACLKTRFRSKRISRGGGLFDAWAAHPGPTLAIWGAEDVTAEPAVLVPRLATQARCTAHIVPGAGHWVQYEAHAVVNEHMARWLESPGVACPPDA